MNEHKPVILYVELSPILRDNVSDMLQADMPNHTVISVTSHAQASECFDRCNQSGAPPLVVTENRPAPEATKFIEKALAAGATVIIFTGMGAKLKSHDPSKLVTVEKPGYQSLLSEVRRQTRAVERTTHSPAAADPGGLGI